jgi:hypothetical protein
VSFDLGDGGLAPYLILIVFGFLPSEVWRWLSVVMARNIDEGSPVFVLARTIASVLLVGVVGRLILSPLGALALTPLWARLGALGVAAAFYLAFKRSVIAAVLSGEVAIMLATWHFTR